MTPNPAVIKILRVCESRRRALCGRAPALAQRFVDVSIPGWGVVLPFLPIGCFREFRIFAPDDGSGAERVFRSSGSTQDQRAIHEFSQRGIEGYASASIEGYRVFLERFGQRPGVRLLSLVPPPSVWSESSLAAMIGMFANAGEPVRWCDWERDPDAFFAAYQDALASGASAVVVFGTSFHHLALDRLARGRSWVAAGEMMRLIVDTGGTKGRVESLTSAEMVATLERLYSLDFQRDYLVSEYGMCELASQAWSRESPHGGNFLCNDGLEVLAVQVEAGGAARASTEGFLGFVDLHNVDSYPAILTEDWGSILPRSTEGLAAFFLQGRAPDASLKGCSLQVREGFLFSFSDELAGKRDLDLVSTTSSRTSPNLDCALGKRVLSRLEHSASWNNLARGDLGRLLEPVDWATWPCRQRSDRRLHLVASANIPVTALFPVLAAAALGYGEVTVQLPSVRPDDPFATLVRQQIQDLLRALGPDLGSLRLRMVSHAALPEKLTAADCVIVFGTDAACATYRRALKDRESEVCLLEFGSVSNVMEWTPATTLSTVVDACVAWFGRGCLTPVALVCQPDCSVDAAELQRVLASQFAERLQNASLLPPPLHVHDLLTLFSELRAIGLAERIHWGTLASVVDLRGWSADLVPWLRMGGMGLLFLVSPADVHFGAGTIQESAWPTASAPHMGRTWLEWLS